MTYTVGNSYHWIWNLGHLFPAINPAFEAISLLDHEHILAVSISMSISKSDYHQQKAQHKNLELQTRGTHQPMKMAVIETVSFYRLRHHDLEKYLRQVFFDCPDQVSIEVGNATELQSCSQAPVLSYFADDRR